MPDTQENRLIKIGNATISKNSPTYFIADVAANHDGDLEKAKDLIYAVAEAGGDAAKFQNFQAETIVSDHGFKSLGGQLSHQSKWEKSVFETYQDASLPLEWTETLKETCDKAGVDYFTSPYSPDLIKAVSPYVAAWKMGSGDVTWHESIRNMARTGKPVILATGASTMQEVEMAVAAAKEITDDVILMQCNTNYTANSDEPREDALARMACINLRVLDTYAKKFPDVILGLSDHTLGHTTVLGAVALFGARAVEKHFTLDNNAKGPDHPFSMNPTTWREMVDATRAVESKLTDTMTYDERVELIRPYVDMEELEASMGDGRKRIEDNERDTCVLQRRAICVKHPVKAGHVLAQEDIFPLRPAIEGGFEPYQTDAVIGKAVVKDFVAGEMLRQDYLAEGDVLKGTGITEAIRRGKTGN